MDLFLIHRGNTVPLGIAEKYQIKYDSRVGHTDGESYPDWLVRLVNINLVCRIIMSFCMYISAANGWMSLMRNAALRCLADLIGARCATVNFPGATESAFSY